MPVSRGYVTQKDPSNYNFQLLRGFSGGNSQTEAEKDPPRQLFPATSLTVHSVCMNFDLEPTRSNKWLSYCLFLKSNIKFYAIILKFDLHCETWVQIELLFKI